MKFHDPDNDKIEWEESFNENLEDKQELIPDEETDEIDWDD